MQQVTIGTKNQIVIPKDLRKQIKGLRPGRKVGLYSLDQDTIVIKVDAQNWLESSYGLMKNAWSKSNPLQTLEQLRTEW